MIGAKNFIMLIIGISMKSEKATCMYPNTKSTFQFLHTIPR